MINKESISTSFNKIYQQQASVTIKAPGRINIIGEHTDYNNGFVLPAAIDKYIYIAINQRNDNELHLYSENYQEKLSIDLNSSHQAISDWGKYILGVSQLINDKKAIKGFNLYVMGDIPLGAGLSSSAALSCGTAYALNELFNIQLTQLEIAKIGQITEHKFIGLQCGIMDQFASVFGKKDQLLLLDCKDLKTSYININLTEFELILLNTNVKHNLANTAYNNRKKSCEKGIKWIKEKYLEIQSLRDISIEQLNELVLPQDTDVYTKCKFIIEENNRVLQAVEAIKKNKIHELGELLFEAHWALSRQYEVSCPELDFLIAEVQKMNSVIGARMMGGGFGGCTINIVQKGQSKDVIEKLSFLYKEKFTKDLTPISIKIADGISLLN